MINYLTSKKTILIVIPILSLILAFLIQEDLSTGGSRNDFIRTFPTVIDLSNFIFDRTNEYTRHFPLHYYLLSIPQLIFDNIFITKLIYFCFSFSFPYLIYLNIAKIYPKEKFNALLIASSLMFLPFYRASVIWPNAHLTALIFLLISNYFYLINQNSEKFIYKFINLFFLALSAYCMQSYSVFFLFYIFHYYKNDSIDSFLYLVFACFLFSIPGFYMLIHYSAGSKLNFSYDASYTLTTNFSIIFFCLLLFLINKKSFNEIKKRIISLNKIILGIFFLFFLILISFFENNADSGGGFFYKFSNFLFNNNIFFYFTALLGMVIFYFSYALDKKIFYIIMLCNFTAIGYATSQKYFEPLLIVLIFVLNKNFFSKNIITYNFNSLIFYFLCFSYFIVALFNNKYGLSLSF